MRCAYIAGPYRDPRGAYYVRQNIRVAEEAGIELIKAGFAVMIPHKNTEMVDGPVSNAQIMEQELELLRRCDFVLMVGEWNRSEGAMEERRVAISEKKRVYTSTREAIEWESR